MSASHHKSTQAHARPGQTESQVNPGFQLASTYDFVWPGLYEYSCIFCQVQAKSFIGRVLSCIALFTDSLLTCENIEEPAVCGIILSCLYLQLCPARRFQESTLLGKNTKRVQVVWHNCHGFHALHTSHNGHNTEERIHMAVILVNFVH